MKKKKTILIVVIVLIVLLIVAGGTFAFLYFGTDLLKSEKELFAKYVVQMGSEEAPFISSSMVEYATKKETTPYENNGNLMVNMELLSTASNSEMQMLQNIITYGNQASITFNGKIDNKNQLVEENINLNYTDSVNLPIIYKQEGERYGLQSEPILPGYWLAVENNNIPALLQNLGMTNTDSVPYRIESQEFSSFSFSAEEIQHLLTNYVIPLYENISEEHFSKTKNPDGSETYSLVLTNQELLNLFVQALQSLSQDTLMLDKLNNAIQELGGSDSLTITAEDIQNTANDLTETAVEEGSVEISMTQVEGRTNRIGISTSDGVFSIEIVKNETDSDVLYTITVNTAGISEAILEISYTGINTNVVTENILVTISRQEVTDTAIASQMPMNIEYSYTNTVTFGSEITISPFGDNTILLNNYPAEQLQPFLERLGMTIVDVNTNQMIQIGYPTDMVNPILMWVIAPVLADSLTQSSSITGNLDIAEMQANNASFEAYKGTTRGSNVITLCTLIKNYNLQNTTRRINVNLGVAASATTFLANVNDIDAILNSIQAGDTYQVSLSYDTATGYVCEIGIVSTTAPIAEDGLTDITVNPEDYSINSVNPGDYNLNAIFSEASNFVRNDTIVSTENVDGNFVETVE